ncbi:hypothetical protein DB345_06585 [Spartobacteria bacterium LR76]|nr:hypothetical protein DB345_06585 [Spartobacteria bacterium LR76]
MVRRIALAAVLFLLGLYGAGAAVGPAPFRVLGMAPDNTGRLYVYGGPRCSQLAVLDGEQWTPLPPTGPGGAAVVQGILGLKNGGVVVLWELKKGKWAAMILKDLAVEKVIPFDWPEESRTSIKVVEDSNEGIWLCRNSQWVVKVELESGRAISYDVKPFCETRNTGWYPFHFFEDSRGGRWIWGDNGKDGRFVPLKADGEMLVGISMIDEPKDDILDVVRKDDDFIWLVGRNRLYVMNLDSYRVEEVHGPAGKSFGNLNSLVAYGSGWLLFDWPHTGRRVWELNADREWVQREFPPGGWPYEAHSDDRRYCQTPDGAFLLARDGAIFFPFGKTTAEVIDWRRGWAMGSAWEIVPIANDRFFIFAKDDRSPEFAVVNSRELLEEKPVADVMDVPARSAWTIDSQDRVFTFFEERDLLCVWTGAEWRKVPLPSELRYPHDYEVLLDARERIWVIPGYNDSEVVGILSPNLEDWDVLPDLKAALVKYREELGTAFRNSSFIKPVVGGKGYVAYQTAGSWLKLWDGKKWRGWGAEQIAGRTGRVALSQPFYSPEGDLCVMINHPKTTYRLVDAKSWQLEPRALAGEEVWPDRSGSPPGRKVPEGFEPHDIDDPYVSEDNLGRIWVAGTQQLYVFRNGKTVPVFRDGRVHPFLGRCHIREVRVDKAGNTWIQRDYDRPVRVMIPNRNPTLDKVALKLDDWGGLKLETDSRNEIEFRLDEGKWTSLKSPERVMGHVFQGKHVVEVRFITPDLEVVGPTRLECDFPMPVEKQFAHFAARFATGTDREREEAVTLLKQKPAEALAVLREWKPESETEKWWIQAAVQECEREAAKRR